MTKPVNKRKAEVGQRLVQLRTALGMDQYRFALECKLTRSALSNWELGYTFPSYDQLARIRTYTQVTADWILYGDERGLTVPQRDDLARAAKKLRAERNALKRAVNDG